MRIPKFIKDLTLKQIIIISLITVLIIDSIFIIAYSLSDEVSVSLLEFIGILCACDIIIFPICYVLLGGDIKEELKQEKSYRNKVISAFSKDSFKEIRIREQNELYYSFINPIIESEGYKYYAKMCENGSIIIRIIRFNNGDNRVIYERPVQMSYMQFHKLFYYE